MFVSFVCYCIGIVALTELDIVFRYVGNEGPTLPFKVSSLLLLHYKQQLAGRLFLLYVLILDTTFQ